MYLNINLLLKIKKQEDIHQASKRSKPEKLSNLTISNLN